MRTRTLLVVEHQAGAPAAMLGEWMGEEGIRLDVRRPYAGDRLPVDLRDHDGLLVLGGGMDSWDDAGHPWLPETRALVRTAETSGVPTLGICLGHQIASAALGGEVGRNPAGATLAVLPVGWGAGATTDPLLGAVVGVGVAAHWNDDIVLRLPEGAELLAVSPDGAVQAARLGRSVWGVQFHPEAGLAVLEGWVAEEGAPYAERGIDLELFLAEVRRAESELMDGWRRLAGSFARLIEETGQ